eukprot:TRINITY_DN505_c0_g1_i1.p1 TRINITY_DN505_c0_g1~~TRINITY_DN505_c0_g1_i1.p1  ORF type:complete len:325 (+),score=70.52 TRINITY_DN505_c0_g1_i1:89-1063(+)
MCAAQLLRQVVSGPSGRALRRAALGVGGGVLAFGVAHQASGVAVAEVAGLVGPLAPPFLNPSGESMTVRRDAPRWPCRRVAVYGGAFNPISNAHLTCAAQLMHSGLVDEVLIVPSADRHDHPAGMESFADRITMCEIAISSAFSRDFPVTVSDEEGQHAGGIDTYALLKSLSVKNPGAEFHFVVGSDWLQPEQDLRSWHPCLAGEFHFIILERPGFPIPGNLHQEYGPRFRMLKAPGTDYNFIDSNLSSTEIRRRARATPHDPRVTKSDRLHLIEGLVDRGVLSYIARHNLYSSGRGESVDEGEEAHLSFDQKHVRGAPRSRPP